MKHFQRNLKSLESVDGTKNAAQLHAPDKKMKSQITEIKNRLQKAY